MRQHVIWKDIVGYESLYLISDHGQVVSKRGVKKQKLHHGYFQVSLCKGGIQKTHTIHRLVAEAFIGQCPKNMECRHLDGNRKNNNVKNLSWGTSKQNAEDRKFHGTNNNGERNGKSKLTNDDVSLILKMNDTQGYIAEKFGVNQSTISLIKNRKMWSHINE